MKAVNWVCYSWNLANFASVCPEVVPPYAVRRAALEDLSMVKTIVLSSFTLDSEWNPFLREVRPRIEALLASAFDEKSEPLCLVVAHGSRIIGASLLSADREAANHLLTGPCISMEYRNRGLATVLLAQSLLALREAGLQEARGVTKQGSTASHFIYTKFDSTRLQPATGGKS